MGNTTGALVIVVAAAAGIWAFCFIVGAAQRLGLSSVKAADSNGRSLSRFCTAYRANIQLLDHESAQTARAYIINLSEYGARVRYGSALAVGTRVRLRIPEISSAATGRVRNCARKWYGYQLGLEFQGTLYKTSF
jgi:PilZ domain